MKNSEKEISEALALKRTTLIAATAAAFLTPFMASSVNLAIPTIGKEFGAGALELGWVVTGYLLASAAFLLPFGKVADLVGRRKVFVSGIVSFALFALLCGFAQNIEMLIALRVFQGISSAMIFGTGIAILTSVFPANERGRVLGINSAFVYLGLSLGPVLGGALNHYLGWQSIFFVNAAFGAIAFHFARRLKGEWVGAPGEKYDFLGSVMYSAGLVLVMYGVSSITESPLAGPLILIGTATLVVFGILELRKKYPLFNFRLFIGNTTFTFSNIATLINYSATFAVSYLMSVYLQSVSGYDSQFAGLVLLAQPVVMVVLSPIAGRLSDRRSPRKIASLGMAITVVSLLAFSQVGINTPLHFLVFSLMFFGAGLALFSSPNTNAVMGSVERSDYGVASSILGTMRLIGQAVSMAVVTLVMAAYIGNSELAAAPAERLTACINTLFYIFAALSFAGIFASLASGEAVKLETQNRRK